MMNKFRIIFIHFLFILGILNCPVVTSQNINYADSLKQVLKHAEGKHFIEVSNNLCRYFLNSEPDLALNYAYNSLNEAFKNNSASDKIITYNLLGIVYVNKNHYDSAFINFNKSIKLAYLSRDTSQIMSVINNIGFVNYRIGNYQEALTNFYQSLNYYERSNDKPNIATAHNNIGLIYNELKDYAKALSYYLKALDLGKKEKNHSIIISSMTNIGFLYFRSGEPNKALVYLNKALVYCKKYNDKFNESKIYKEFGIIALANKDYDKAIKNLEVAEKYNIKLKNYIELASVYERLSECYLAMNKLDKALELANLGLKYSRIVVNKRYLARSYNNISNIYEKKGNYKKALQYYRKSTATNAEIFDQQKISLIYNMQLQYETEKSAGQIAELNRQKQMQSLIISKRNWQIVVFGVFFVLVLILLYLFYKNKRNKQSMELEAAIHSLKQQRAMAVLEAENRERKRIGEELHESLSQILLLAKLTISSLKINDRYLTIKQKETINNSINLLNNAFEELRNISHNLTPFLLKEKGLTESVRDMLVKVENTNNCRVNFEEVGFNERLGSSLETTLYRVIQEVINNIVRHAKASEINFQIIKTEKDLTIMLEDNGIGFEVLKLKESNGIGIRNIYSRIENLNGTVLIDSAIGRGTIFTLIIPLN